MIMDYLDFEQQNWNLWYEKYIIFCWKWTCLFNDKIPQSGVVGEKIVIRAVADSFFIGWPIANCHKEKY